MQNQHLLDFKKSNYIKSFGRLKGKNFGPKDLENLESYKFKPECFDFKSWPTSLEIGFGYGEHLVELAKSNMQKSYIGAEVYLSGVAAIIKKIDLLGLKNIYLWCDDARSLLQNLQDHCLEDIFLLFPDPWPKKRHNKRRIVNKDFLNLVAKKIRQNLIIATDHAEYAEYIKTESSQVFKNVKEIEDCNINTRYKKKATQKIKTFKISNA